MGMNVYSNREEILERINAMTADDRDAEVVDYLMSFPEEDLTDELKGLLARAYNNTGEYEKALPLLVETESYGRETANWNFRMGYSLYFLGDYEGSLKYFSQALEIEPDDEDTKWFIAQCNINMPFRQRVVDFWKWFSENSADIEEMLAGRNDGRGSLSDLMAEGMSIIGEDVYYNIGGDRELTFCVEGNTECYYLYPYLVDNMPLEPKDRWTVHSCQHPSDISGFTFRMYDKDIPMTEILVRADYDAESSAFDLCYHHPALAELDEAKSINAFYVILQHAIGEGAVYNYVYDVRQSDSTDGMYPIGELSSGMKNMLENNGKEYHTEPELNWCTYRCEPKEDSEKLREEIICGNSRFMLLNRQYMEGDMQCYRDLALKGASAMFLMITIPDGWGIKEFMDMRYTIEDRIESMFGNSDTPGLLLGGAMGNKDIAYIDVLLFDGPGFLRHLNDPLVMDDLLRCGDGSVMDSSVYAKGFCQNDPMVELRKRDRMG